MCWFVRGDDMGFTSDLGFECARDEAVALGAIHREFDGGRVEARDIGGHLKMNGSNILDGPAFNVERKLGLGFDAFCGRSRQR